MAKAHNSTVAEAISAIDTAQMLHKAISSVITDEEFSLPMEPAKMARLTSEKVLEWSSDNKTEFLEFSNSLVSELWSCFDAHTALKKIGKQREKMWERFHKTRSSESFRQAWISFLRSAGCAASPAFYQYVTDFMMSQLIKLKYPVAQSPTAVIEDEESPACIDYEDSNALRYCAGYIVRSLQKKAEDREQVRCLEEMIEGSEESSTHESADWMNAIDRGGLVHVNDTVFSFFMEMESVVRRHLDSRRTTCDQELHQLVPLIVSNEKVLFTWEIVAVNWQQEDAQALLQMIADQWVTMRGFSFAKSIMETYKNRSKKTVQKSKGVRKQLQND